MNAFKRIQTTDANVNRLQSNVQEWTDQFSAPVTPVVLPVIFTPTINSYLVKPTDAYIVVDARGGAGKIILPTPARATQTVAVKSQYDSNKVTIVQADGKTMGDGAASIDITSRGSAFMVNTGRAWVRF